MTLNSYFRFEVQAMETKVFCWQNKRWNRVSEKSSDLLKTYISLNFFSSTFSVLIITDAIQITLMVSMISFYAIFSKFMQASFQQDRSNTMHCRIGNFFCNFLSDTHDVKLSKALDTFFIKPTWFDKWTCTFPTRITPIAKLLWPLWQN